MEIAELVSTLQRFDPEGRSGPTDWIEVDGLWAELSQKTENILHERCLAAFCMIQEWDRRIDCLVKLSDGSIIGEMIGLRNFTVERLHETADRLARRCTGEAVELIDPLQPPLYIGRGRSQFIDG